MPKRITRHASMAETTVGSSLPIVLSAQSGDVFAAICRLAVAPLVLLFVMTTVHPASGYMIDRTVGPSPIPNYGYGYVNGTLSS
jgi:hypothetical protein